MASKIILACGIPIPNGNMEFKSDGLGQGSGWPDGFRTSTNLQVDLIFSRARTRWTTTRRGDASYPYAPIFASRARALTVGVSNSGIPDVARYIDSPPSPPGFTWVGEAVDPFATTNDYWWVRLRLWWRGHGIAPGAAAAWVFQVWGYNNAAESAPTLLCTIPLNGVTDWDPTQGWVLKSSTPFKITSTVHHVRVRLVAERGPATAGFAYGSCTDFSVETLGPIDAVSGAGGAEINNPTYAAEGNGGTYYQLLRDRQWEGCRVTPLRMGKSSRMPSGGWRWVDPSGGSMRRRFTIPVRLLTRVDYDKLLRLFNANKGLSTDPGSYYGVPFPLVFSPQSVDEPGFYYVAFEDDKFPLEPDGEFMGATLTGALYKGVLNLVEV